MSKAVPTIQKFMTTAPHSVGNDQSIATASAMMTTHGIRHLPVLHGGKLRGILTDRDIKVLAAFESFDSAKLKVEEVMTETPYTVGPDCALDEVVSVMAEKKYGSAVIEQNNRVVGIFTTVDACRALKELLHSRLK